MAHFALICPPFASHIHSFAVLGEELVRRGHRATFVLNAGAPVRGTELPVERVAARAGDPSIDRILRSAIRPSGLLGTLRTIADSAAQTDQLCAGAPAILQRLGADAIIADQLEPAGGLLGAGLRLPFVSLAVALPINSAPGVVLPFLDWPYDASPRGLKRVRGAERITRLLSRRQRRVVASWSDRFALHPQRRTLEDCLSPYAQIAQVVRGYDFPRPEPMAFVGVGPLRRPAEEAADQPLPFDFHPHRPLVFATFGTLQGGRIRLFRAIAQACREAGADLLVAHGGQLSPNEAASIGATFVTDFVPYRAVLKHASLCITHGGSNTVLDALACGVPLLVRPVAFDQKGNLARVLHHGLGERLAGQGIAAQIRRVLADPTIRDRCLAIAVEISQAGGRSRAADIAEGALARG
ncbi:MAG TPA: glycosyltransferase [Sphingomicrobium sp.]|nr:glycosyltransferase [Sphingomicrobium sp.]